MPRPKEGVLASRDGVSLRVLPGWNAQLLAGRTVLRNYTHPHGNPRSGEISAVLDESSSAFAHSDPTLRYPPLRGRLRIAPGEFSSSALRGGNLDASKLFEVSGRYFQLAVIYGPHTSPAADRILNRMLGGLRVAPAVPAPLLVPPTFAPASGWTTKSTPSERRQPQGDQLCAWASTIPYRDANTCPIPTATIARLGPSDMVITVNAYRDWTQPNYPGLRALNVPRKITTLGEGGYRSALMTGTTASGYAVEINVWIGKQARFSDAMRRRAQAEISRLRLPTWPRLAPAQTVSGSPAPKARATRKGVRFILPSGWSSRTFSGGLGSDPSGVQVLVAGNRPLPATVSECDALIPRLTSNQALVRIYDYGTSPLAPRAARVAVVKFGKIQPVRQPNGRVTGFNETRVRYRGHALTVDTSFGSAAPSAAIRQQVAAFLRGITTR